METIPNNILLGSDYKKELCMQGRRNKGVRRCIITQHTHGHDMMYKNIFLYYTRIHQSSVHRMRRIMIYHTIYLT